MDPEAVFERANVMRQDDLLPRSSEGETWVAVDPETECRGVGEFEEDARSNLVHAVEAYREDVASTTGDGDAGSTVPYMSAGGGQTVKMRWLDEDDDATVASMVWNLLPF